MQEQPETAQLSEKLWGSRAESQKNVKMIRKEIKVGRLLDAFE